MPSWSPIKVDVEFMDGERRTYQCGGMLSPAEALQEGGSVLVMLKRDGEFADTIHVASLPIVNLREWKASRA